MTPHAILYLLYTTQVSYVIMVIEDSDRKSIHVYSIKIQDFHLFVLPNKSINATDDYEDKTEMPMFILSFWLRCVSYSTLKGELATLR
ncbi:uncharacterized protein METZ01_LOCUS482859 [marine metagenome]|uniref:Uncharacterized protein n=1 Tax=marine metagenome TaxID=408172 RepID=A0A383CE77_9ZZZZ